MRGRGKRDESKEREREHSGVKEERGESRLNGLRWVVREKREKDLEESGERVNSDRLWGEKEQYLILFFLPIHRFVSRILKLEKLPRDPGL